MTYACRIDDVPLGEGRVVTLDGRRIAVFRAAGGWYALDAACPHLGGPLADGIVCDRAVICPLHDRRYDLATGEPLGAGEPVAAHGAATRRPRVRRGRCAGARRGLTRRNRFNGLNPGGAGFRALLGGDAATPRERCAAAGAAGGTTQGASSSRTGRLSARASRVLVS